ncbi:MAG: polysaccharide biosynthesis C-terminal domain-containing protein [Clostridiales bacterium]|nr:polysaccharide biosynthesis C-terminal domain-containing protein [Clostridiales bacterium]
MNSSRKKRVKKSVITTLILQATTLICGFVVPRSLLGAYGSEAYGATTSIAQFLSYITLLEGGIGGVARAALYKPLAENNTQKISVIVNELKMFFRIIAYIALGYALVLACTFKSLSHIECYDWMTTFWLVLVIAVSIFGQYFIGISYSALIQADQRVYLINALTIVTTLLNAVFVIVLVKIGSSLIIVKLVSSIVFLFKPTAMWIYVRKKYGIVMHPKRDRDVLSQRWTGLGHHIAYYIHSNTDVTVLTVIENLKSVSVYSVHNMITQNIQNVVTALCSGQEALFGDMIARNENRELNDTFNLYETILSVACTVLFSVVYVMIVPFISIYTRGIEDINYIRPEFAFLLTTAAVVYCFEYPYITAITAAGHFKQTRWGAYGEAIINLVTSVILVWKLGLEGVAIGTVTAISARLVYSVIYLSKHVLFRPVYVFIKRFLINVFCMGCIVFGCGEIIKRLEVTDYFQWAVCAGLVCVISTAVTLVINLLFYRDTTINACKKIVGRK